LREADDRHTARWMERENRRERAQGKKKRNEEVQVNLKINNFFF